MGIFRQFPYSNFHDLNLDWILAQIKELKETMDQFIVDWGKEVQEEVDNWLNDHPEATTTVLDNSLTEAKFTDELKELTIKDYVTPEMFGAKGDGVTDDYAALAAMFAESKPVYLPANVYATSGTLVYNGNIIFGKGTIKTLEPLVRTLECITDTIVIEGITIDCNNISAGGIYCRGANYTEIKHCKVFDTNNNLFAELLSCYGIYTTGYSLVNTHDNFIYNINRTQTNPYNISSVGITARTDGFANICNNNIESVHCVNENTDCDGIFVTFATGSHDTAKNLCNISNNIIKDSTGRFIKTQCHHSYINNNDCRLVNTNTGIFFKGIDLQSGGGEISNNYIDVNNKPNNSSKIFHADFTSYLDREIIIRNNLIRFSVIIAQFLDCEGTGTGGRIVIRENTAIGSTTINYVVRCTPSTQASLEIYIENNNIPTYRVINPNGVTNLTNTYVHLIGNRNPTANTVYVFSSAVSINNVVLRDNIGISPLLNNVTLDMSSMQMFEFQYSGSAIANAPAAFSSATHLYLRSCGNKLVQYYNYGNSATGITTY